MPDAPPELALRAYRHVLDLAWFEPGGRVAEAGTHDELVAGGLCAALL